MKREGAKTPPEPPAPRVTDAMSTDYRTVRPDIPVSELASELRQGRERSFPVVGPGNELVGILTQRDVENALLGGNAGDLTAADIMTRAVITCTPSQSIGEALRILTTRDFGLLPVVDGPDSRKLAGVLRRREILWAYGEMAQEHQKLVERVGIDLPAHQKDSVQIEVPVRQEHRALCSRQIREIELPDNCLIVLLRRADRAIIPRGKTVVEAGDSLVFLTTRANEARLREWVDRLGGEGSA